MNAGAHESQSVPVDVLPPVPKDAYSGVVTTEPSNVPPPPFPGARTFYHPASGVVILGLDWLVFGTEAGLDFLTGFMALPFLCVLAFLISFPVLYVIQRKWALDKRSSAIGKAFIGAFLVAIPTPITGTLLGAGIIALAGLPHHPVDAVKKLASKVTMSSPR